MKHTVSKQLLADFEGSHQTILPFDSITFEFSDHSDSIIGCEATKTVQVDALKDCDYDTLNELLKLAVIERDAQQLAADLRHVSKSKLEGFTDQQIKSVIRKYKQNPDGSPNLDAFFGRVQVYQDYAGLQWCGMFLGIEPDGYTHS